MAAFVATKARIVVTVATAGAMFAGVAGLQAQAQEATVLANATETVPSVTPTIVAAPTVTASATHKKKKKAKKVAVVVQAPVVQQKATPKSHGSSSGSK